MKRPLLLKKIFVLFSVLVGWMYPCESNAQTILGPGDIAVIGIKTAGSGNDAIKLLTLVELACDTKFIVTDNNRRSNNTWYCDNEEFAIEITVNQRILAGSVFYFEVAGAGGIATVSTGAITKVGLGNPWGANYGLNSGGDNVFVLQGTRANPTFIYGIRHHGTFASGGSCGSKDNTSLPAGLTLGSTAIEMTSDQDDWHYVCTNAITSGTQADLLTSISNNSNWGNNNSGYAWNSTNCVFNVTDQWPINGVISVTGAGCGCVANCDLSGLGGPNCGGAGVNSNCSAGYIGFSRDIEVPVGCTYTVYATMSPWFGCAQSGADNDGADDRMKVDVSGGAKAFQNGGSNSIEVDDFSLSGPGTITISGFLNRADEVVVYRIIEGAAGDLCGQCAVLLPVELLSFDARFNGRIVELAWSTSVELNSAYFSIERSKEANEWEQVALISAAGYSSQQVDYTLYDSSPFDGISYYRLTEMSTDGTSITSEIRSVQMNDLTEKVVMRYNSMGQEVNEYARGVVILRFESGATRRVFID